MKQLFLALPLLILGQAAANAQSAGIKHPFPSATEARQKVTRMLHSAIQLNRMAKSTANPERVLAEADYDYTNGPGHELQDSIRLTYSGIRSATFDYDNLYYDLYNSSDYPPTIGNIGYVQYDSALIYDPAAPGSPTLLGRRLYNANNKITRFDQSGNGPDTRSLFTYDAGGKLLIALNLDYNTSTSTWDSSYRDFYTYSPAGFVIRDSSESYQMGAWSPQGTTEFTNNASGYPVVVTGIFYMGPVPVTFYQVNVTYASGSNISRFIIQADQGSGLENLGKDTMGYSGTTRNYYDSYNWDTTAHNWVLARQERRHLNAGSQPDSIFRRADQGFGTWDTTYLKLSYNANGNPTSVRNYIAGIAQPQAESKYYYVLPTLGLKPIAPLTDITAYPNPATNTLYLRGGTLSTTGNWHYQISNIAGQVLESGTIPSSAAIQVNALPTGMYNLSVVDAQNKTHIARFQKQ